MSKSVSRKMGVMVVAGVGVIALAVVIATSQMGSNASSAVGQPAAARSAADGSSGGGSATTPSQPGGSAAATAAGSPAAASGGAAAAASSPGGPGATTSPPTTRTSIPPTTAHTTPSTTAHSTTTATPAAPAGPPAAVLGTYRYHQVGTLPGTPSEGTLVVSAGPGQGTEVWTRNVGGSLPPATTNMSFTANGAFLLTPSDPLTGTASCTFAQPVPWPPYPTTPGRSASANATCTAPITTYQVSSQVQATSQVSLGGTTVTAAVVVNTFVIKGNYNGGAINVTLTETDEYAPNLAVPVVTTTHMSGTALGLSVTTQRTDTLESANPS